MIIDWQLWRVGRGAFDLAYMIALHGEADHRAEVEGEALMFYAAELAKHGVHYRWPDLRRDYALGAALDLLYPVRLCALGVPEAVWAPHLRRGFAAFDDLGCASVLGI